MYSHAVPVQARIDLPGWFYLAGFHVGGAKPGGPEGRFLAGICGPDAVAFSLKRLSGDGRTSDGTGTGTGAITVWFSLPASHLSAGVSTNS